MEAVELLREVSGNFTTLGRSYHTACSSHRARNPYPYRPGCSSQPNSTQFNREACSDIDFRYPAVEIRADPLRLVIRIGFGALICHDWYEMRWYIMRGSRN